MTEAQPESVSISCGRTSQKELACQVCKRRGTRSVNWRKSLGHDGPPAHAEVLALR